MPEQHRQAKPVLPSYARDLRHLVSRALDAAAPASATPVPGGPIPYRVRAAEVITEAEDIACIGTEAAVVANIVKLEPERFWPLALPDRVLITGPLLALAAHDLPPDRLALAERRLLKLNEEVFLGTPLPLSLLRLLGRQAHAEPSEGVSEWLEQARLRLRRVESADALVPVRRQLREEVLRQLGALNWTQSGAALAEFSVDVLVLCRAAELDLRAAITLSVRTGSVAQGMVELDQAGELTFEALLPELGREVAASSFTAHEAPWISALTFGRQEIWKEGLLPRAEATPVRSVRPAATATPSEPKTARSHKGPPKAAPETNASEEYQRIRQVLTQTIIGDQLISDLALIATAHARGVRNQRVLLCGPTSSGKSHSARALAEAATGASYLRVAVPDLSATGWRGGQLNEVLDGWIPSARETGGVLLLDEVDKVRLIAGSDGNSRQSQLSMMASLMPLLDAHPITTDSSAQLDTDRLLIVGSGAFEGRFDSRPPTTDELISWGWTAEFAGRWSQRLCLSLPDRAGAMALLRGSERSVGRRLGPLLEAFEIGIHVPEHVIAYAADMWLALGTDYRTAAEWLLAGARACIIRHLDGAGPAGARLELTPDDLPVRPRGGGGR